MADRQPSVRTRGVLGSPFPEQLAFFRNKLDNLVPTSRWDDIRGSAHDSGFMVAGAMKADLLSDLAAAVDRAAAEGKSLSAFRKDFRDIVQRNGWHGWTGQGSAGGERWRTRIIYRTNMASSYAAGRVAQLREGGFRYWIYKHNDSVRNPRPRHLGWDGLTLSPDHPFWRTHTPINGWGCQCYVLGARTESMAKRMGGDPGREPPDDWDHIDDKTGAPQGIDKGWDYQPGDTVSDTVRTMADKTRQWDYELAKGYMQGVPASQRDRLAKSYRSLPSVADDARRYAQRVLKGEGAQLQPYQTLGLLTETDTRQVQALHNRDVAMYDFALDASAVAHVQRKHGQELAELARGQRAISAEDYAVLPQLLNEGDAFEDAGVADRTGNALVRRWLKTNGELFTAVFEIRQRRKMLVLQTFYVRSLSESEQ